MKLAIKHEYDAKLEAYKLQLNANFDTEMASHKSKLAVENAVAVERLKAELQLAHHREQHKTEYAAEDAARRLLSHKGYVRRSFAAIQTELGGYDGDGSDELRRILVRAGARRMYRKGTKKDPENEWWMLVSRMDEWIQQMRERDAKEKSRTKKSRTPTATSTPSDSPQQSE